MPMQATFRLRPLVHSLVVALAATSSVVHALPQGATLAGGSATVSSAGNTATVTQTSSSAILDWKSFSLTAGEHVNFIQPFASASILNRVVGNEPSSILGQISANGHVFLVNPNGIIFGQGSRVDAAGLVASTANISNANFLAGKYQFDQVGNRQGTIVNRGEITVQQGGLVALVAPGVENSGIIRADLGRVALASGNAFTLDLYGDRLVTFAVPDKVSEQLTDAGGVPLAAYVSNTGTITADGGSVLIAANVARTVVNNAINLSGFVRAESVAQHAGEIVLSGGDGEVRVDGTLNASGSNAGAGGGTITVTGRDIQLAAGALLDASGSGGGSIKVGGDFQGGGILAHADVTRVDSGAVLRADGGAAGNGGQVVLWSDRQTDFAGSISARGGEGSGNGGSVETSSKGVLNYSGSVDLAAPRGVGGSLLLDPVELTIDATLAGSLSTTLRGGAAATSVTTSGDLVVASVIDGRGGTAGGSLTLSSGAGISVNADIYTNNGAVTLNAGTAGAGGITMGATGGIATTPTLIYSGSGAITLNATGGNISAQNLVTSGDLALKTTTSGNISLNQNVGGTAGLGSLNVQSAGDAALSAVKATGSISATSGASSSVFVNGILDAGTTLALGTSGGAVKLRHNVKAGGNITFNADVYVNPHDEFLVQVSGTALSPSANTDLSFSSAAALEAYMTSNNIVARAGTTTTVNNVIVSNSAAWDPVAVRATIQSNSGSITFNKGLLWDGTGSITDANSFALFRYYSGQNDALVSRANLTPIGTRYFQVQFNVANGQSVNFAGSGFVGWDKNNVPGANPAFPDNPGTSFINPSSGTPGSWCAPISGPAFGLVLSSTQPMSFSGNYAGSALFGNSPPVNPTTLTPGGGTSSLQLSGPSNSGFAGQFAVPTATAAGNVQLNLFDIALPGIQPLSSGGGITVASTTNSLTNTVNTVSTSDAGVGPVQNETRSPGEVADLGRGVSPNGRDPFALDFRLVSSSGEFAGQPYFTEGLFDFAANNAGQRRRDSENR